MATMASSPGASRNQSERSSASILLLLATILKNPKIDTHIAVLRWIPSIATMAGSRDLKEPVLERSIAYK